MTPRGDGQYGAAASELSERTALGHVVALAFLVRLLALAASLGGLVGSRLTPEVLVATLLLAATSFAGLSNPRVLDAVVDRPVIATADVAVVLGVLAILGVQSPLALATLSTALLVGVLFRARVALFLATLLVLGYGGAALLAAARGEELGFFLALGMPATYACLVAIGLSFRRITAAQLCAAREVGHLQQTAAVADERTRLAREVHDSLAKSLQGLALSASALPTWIDRDPSRAKEQARTLADGARLAVAEARTLLLQMRTDEPGKPFHLVLDQLVSTWAEQHGHTVRAALRPVPGIDASARYEVLAAVREALENVHRHAPEAAVEVRADVRQRRLVVEVVDDGPGLDRDLLRARERAGHFGLRGMHERMAAVGGHAQLLDTPGGGTTVRLTVDVPGASLLPLEAAPDGVVTRD